MIPTTAVRGRRAIAAVTAATIAFPSAVAADPSREAAAHVAAATEAHKEGRYEDALVELEKAYDLDPQPSILYAFGQVHVKLGKCQSAIDYYTQYLGTNPPAGPAQNATQAINACKVVMAQQGAASRTVDPAPAEPVAHPPEPHTAPETSPATRGDGPDAAIGSVAPLSPPRPPRRMYQDPLVLGVVGAGVATSAAAAVLYVTARGMIADADAAPSYGEAQALTDAAADRRTLSIVVAAVGGGLVVGGIVLGIARQDRRETRVTVAPTSDGGFVTFAGRF